MRRTTIGLALAAGVVGVSPVASATVLGYWEYDDAASGTIATTLVTEANAPTLNGTAVANGTGSRPTHDSDTPGEVITAGLGGPVVNAANDTSLLFVNASIPGNLNSHDGGRVDVADNNPLTRPINLTVEAFIRIDERVNFPTIVGKSRADSGGTSWTLDLNNNGTLRARVDSQALGTGGTGVPGFNQGFSTTLNLEDGLWHHVAMTYDDTTRALRLFVDYNDIGGGFTTFNLVYDSQPLRVGQGAGGRAFDGNIDEVRISDTVLTTSEFLRAIPEPSALAAILVAASLLRLGRRRIVRG
jgi:hypothetical protein